MDYKTRAQFSYASIAAGAWDKSIILPEARVLKAYHHKVFIDFDREFDNLIRPEGQPGPVRRGIPAHPQGDDAAGVKNVIWAWVSTGYIGNER